MQELFGNVKSAGAWLHLFDVCLHLAFFHFMQQIDVRSLQCSRCRRGERRVLSDKVWMNAEKWIIFNDLRLILVAVEVNDWRGALVCGQLAPDDAWRCPHCKQLQQGMVKMSLWTLPNILILHLKRFRQVGAHLLLNRLLNLSPYFV